MDADALLQLFATAAVAASEAVDALSRETRRRAGGRPGQYHLDLAADAAVLEALRPARAAVVSEESGRSGPDGPVTIVVDPVDGSTNCSRHLPYWSISLCALDADGPWCALVRNQVTGSTTTAIRGRGAWRDGERLVPSSTRRVGDALVALAGIPNHLLRWAQYRSLGSAALTLCDVAAGDVDGYITAASDHAPWDYLGGLLACAEAGATVVDRDGRPLEIADPSARRQLLAAGTPELVEALRPAVAVP